MARPRKRAAPPDARPARNEAPGRDQPARKHPTRTPQNPFEQADQQQDPDDEVTYKVEKVKSMRFLKGVRQYLVAWEGYGEGDDTWEPMANLVGCAAEIKAYEVARAAQDVLDKEELLARRKAAKDKAQQHAEELRQQAREQAMREAGEEPVAINVDEAELAVTANGVLKIHKNKSGVVWSCFDLTVVKPTCKCLANPGTLSTTICGVEPSITAGTTNDWSHLWTHHREKWYELKNKEGKLNASGKAELESVQDALKKMKAGSSSLNHNAGGEFLSGRLPPQVKETLDRVTAEWIIDEDQCFNAASKAGFRRLMSAATNHLYDGCCEKTVKQHAYAMSMEGKEEVRKFHEVVLKEGVKPAASGDLWSKNGTALFGLVSHAIERTEISTGGEKVKAVWTMCEKLTGAVPCSMDRHTGKFIGEISDGAWACSGLKAPVEEIFVRVCNNGSNMLKGWEEGFLSPCCDHTLELSVNLFSLHARIAPTIEKGRGMVGYFNSSTVGQNERETPGLRRCQQSAGLPQCKLTQDVKTRWRSTHSMCNRILLSSC